MLKGWSLKMNVQYSNNNNYQFSYRASVKTKQWFLKSLLQTYFLFNSYWVAFNGNLLVGNNDCCNNSFYAPNEMETKDQSGNRREWGREKEKKEKEKEGEGGRWEDEEEAETEERKNKRRKKRETGSRKELWQILEVNKTLGGPDTPLFNDFRIFFKQFKMKKNFTLFRRNNLGSP